MHACGLYAFIGDAFALHQLGFDTFSCANPKDVVTGFIQFLYNG